MASDITLRDEHVLSVIFRVSMWWRIGYGTLRLFLGAVLLRLVGTPLAEVFYSLMSHEVVEDPTDVVFQFIYTLLENHDFTVTYFLASYLIFWGMIDVFLSGCLLKYKLWAFPLSSVLIAIFILYEIYRIFHTHSPILLLVILVDIFILYIIHREYLVLVANARTNHGEKSAT